MIKAVPFVAVLSCLALSGVAKAEDSSLNYTMEDVTACSPDAMRLCKDKLPDLDAIEACMKAHYASLRPACKARFDKEH